jgi:hypothetical protein
MTKLAGKYEAKLQRLFNVTMKQHYCCHQGMMARYLHPRLQHCYVHEDFMLVVRRLTRVCTAGSNMRLIARKLMELYVRGKHVSMCDKSEVFQPKY